MEIKLHDLTALFISLTAYSITALIHLTEYGILEHMVPPNKIYYFLLFSDLAKSELACRSIRMASQIRVGSRFKITLLVVKVEITQVDHLLL